MAAVFTLNEEEQELLRQKRQERQEDAEREASEDSLRAQAIATVDRSARPAVEEEQERLRQKRQERQEDAEREASEASLRAQAIAKVDRSERPEEEEDLDDEAVAHSMELLRRYGKDIHAIKLAPGSSGSGLGPRVIMVKGTTKMQGADVFDMTAPFLNTGMIPLEGVKGTQEDVRATYSAQLVRFMSTLSPHSPKVSTHFHITGDRAPWAPFFPTKKAHVGIYFDGKRYFLIASMHAGENLANDLAAIASGAP